MYNKQKGDFDMESRNSYLSDRLMGKTSSIFNQGYYEPRPAAEPEEIKEGISGVFNKASDLFDSVMNKENMGLSEETAMKHYGPLKFAKNIKNNIVERLFEGLPSERKAEVLKRYAPKPGIISRMARYIAPRAHSFSSNHPLLAAGMMASGTGAAGMAAGSALGAVQGYGAGYGHGLGNRVMGRDKNSEE
jgi:hypothetical protein